MKKFNLLTLYKLNPSNVIDDECIVDLDGWDIGGVNIAGLTFNEPVQFISNKPFMDITISRCHFNHQLTLTLNYSNDSKIKITMDNTTIKRMNGIGGCSLVAHNCVFNCFPCIVCSQLQKYTRCNFTGEILQPTSDVTFKCCTIKAGELYFDSIRYLMVDANTSIDVDILKINNIIDESIFFNIDNHRHHLTFAPIITKSRIDEIIWLTTTSTLLIAGNYTVKKLTIQQLYPSDEKICNVINVNDSLLELTLIGRTIKLHNDITVKSIDLSTSIINQDNCTIVADTIKFKVNDLYNQFNSYPIKMVARCLDLIDTSYVEDSTHTYEASEELYLPGLWH